MTRPVISMLLLLLHCYIAVPGLQDAIRDYVLHSSSITFQHRVFLSHYTQGERIKHNLFHELLPSLYAPKI
jgi:hypothetical protein